MKILSCLLLLLSCWARMQAQSNSVLEGQFSFSPGQTDFLQNIIPPSEPDLTRRAEKIKLFRLVSQVETTNREVREYAVSQLKASGPTVVNVLTNWLGTPNSIFWQPTMVTALGFLGRMASNATPTLESSARNIDSIVQPRAMVALLRVRGQPVTAITNWLQPSPLPEYYLPHGHSYLYSAIALLGEESKPLHSFLIQVLKKSDSRDAVLAGVALAQLQVSPDVCVPELVKLLEKPEFWSPDRALNSLAAYGPLAASARPSVEKLLKNPKASLLTRIPAIHTIVEITPVEQRQTLVSLLQNLPGDADGILREEAEIEIQRIQQR